MFMLDEGVWRSQTIVGNMVCIMRVQSIYTAFYHGTHDGGHERVNCKPSTPPLRSVDGERRTCF